MMKVVIFLLLLVSQILSFSYFSLVDTNQDKKISKRELFHFLKATEYVKNKSEEKRLKEVIDIIFQHSFGGADAIDESDFHKTFNFLKKSDVTPTQIHLSLSGREGEMIVMWVTFQRLNNSFVEFGTDPNSLNRRYPAISFTYNKGVLGWNGWIYRAILPNLENGKRYYYRVGSPSAEFSSIKSFEYHNGNIQSKPMSIALIGDMGTYFPMGFLVAKQMINDFEKQKYDMTTLVGDIAYADLGTNGKFELAEIWDLYERQVEPIASRMPFMYVVGNHEQYENYTAYQTRFTMPGKITSGFENIYFSYDFAGIHFISICTEDNIAPFTPGSPQYNWLVNDLRKANANRKNVPFIVLQGHRPMYTSFSKSNSLQTHIEPLLKQYNVDIALWGHVHCYYRSFPLYNKKYDPMDTKVYKNPQNPIHLNVASAGALIKDKCDGNDKEDWMAAKMDTYGWTRMNVLNRTTLHFQFNRFTTGEVEDEFYIIKE